MSSVWRMFLCPVCAAFSPLGFPQHPFEDQCSFWEKFWANPKYRAIFYAKERNRPIYKSPWKCFVVDVFWGSHLTSPFGHSSHLEVYSLLTWRPPFEGLPTYGWWLIFSSLITWACQPLETKFVFYVDNVDWNAPSLKPLRAKVDC